MINIKNMFFQIIVFVFIPISNILGQNKVIDSSKYQFRYLLTYQSDTTDINSIEVEEMLLTVGDKYSKFQSLGGYLRDSISNKIKKNKLSSINLMDLLGDIPKTKFKEIIIKDYSKKEIIFKEQIFRDYFEYKDSLELFNWQIKNENKKIGGYNCIKATVDFAGRTYIAWYTTDIPISEGPYKFNDLPGLIIKISDKKNHYNYDLIETKPFENKIYIKDKNYILTTKKEFKRAKKDFYENIFKKLEQNGISINFDDPSQKRNTLNKYKKRNNPIELNNE